MNTATKFAFESNLMSPLRGGVFQSSLYVNTQFDKIVLSVGASRVRDTPNAGGTSVASEVMSFEAMRLLTGAQLSRTEMELEYYPRGKITDYSVVMPNGVRMGVSVTRALKYRGTFTRTDARVLLEKKLFGITESTRTVVGETWPKQVLHVLVHEAYVADVLAAELENLSADLRSNTTVLITLVHNAKWMFYNMRG